MLVVSTTMWMLHRLQVAMMGREGEGRRGKGREGKGREGKGREEER